MALTPGDADPADPQRLLRAVGRALEGGLRAVLVREPHLEDGPLLALAARLAQPLREVGGWLGVHDRAHLAAALDAQAVHLGFRSLPPAAARRVVGEERALGVSTHAGDGPERWAGADYLFHGPLRETPSKRGLLEPIGLAGLAAFCGAVELPVWAIGGLRPEHAAEALAAGAAGVAVLGGLLAAPDPAGAARAYVAAVGRGGRGTP